MMKKIPCSNECCPLYQQCEQRIKPTTTNTNDSLQTVLLAGVMIISFPVAIYALLYALWLLINW